MDEDTAAGFRLGVVDEPLPGHDHMKGWIVIPFLDSEGRAQTIQYRCPEKHDHRAAHGGKYLFTSGLGGWTYNVGAIAKPGASMSVTEGAFDAIVLSRIGVNAIGIPGVNAWGRKHVRLLNQFDRVYVWGDPDEAGREWAKTVLGELGNSRAVYLRGGDISEVYVERGASALLEALEAVK